MNLHVGGAYGKWEEHLRNEEPGTPQHPSGHPAPPHLEDSGRIYCGWGWAASCDRPPEMTTHSVIQ